MRSQIVFVERQNSGVRKGLDFSLQSKVATHIVVRATIEKSNKSMKLAHDFASQSKVKRKIVKT